MPPNVAELEVKENARAHLRVGVETLAALSFAAFSLAACASPAPDVVPIEVRIGAADARCQPSRVRAARLAIEGDFVPEPTDTVELLTAAGVRDLSELRPSLRALRVELDGDPSYRAIGRGAIEELRTRGVLAVLPPLVPCALLDSDVYLPEYGAVLAHADGSAWVVGGHGVERRVLRVDARTRFAEVWPDALFNRRESPTASAYGRDVIVAGGAAGTTDTAYDTYEHLDEHARPVNRGPGGRLSLGRRDHAALVLGARLVLVGGRSGGATDGLLARIDVVDLEVGTAALGPSLTTPRLRPTLALQRDGGIVVAGGVDLAGAPIASIERIDGGLDRVRTIDLALPAPELVLSLPLDRLLHVAAHEVRVIELGGDSPRVVLLSRRTEIASPRGVVMASGRVLLVGADASGRAVAELWTPHRDTASALEAARLPRALVWLRDGIVLELDTGGGSLRAIEEPGAWSSLPNDRLLVPTELASTALVAGLPGDLEGARATRAGVRMGLGAMRLGGLAITVEGEGARVLVLRDPEEPSRVEIAFDAEGNAFGPGCSLTRGTEPITVSRGGARLELVGAGARARCDDVSDTALFALELELERDSELRSLGVSRAAR